MLYIASDHAGFNLKSLIQEKFGATDLGCDSAHKCDYPDFGFTLGKHLKEGDRGILVCGSGCGISIAANKVQGVRCAFVQDVYTAKLAA